MTVELYHIYIRKEDNTTTFCEQKMRIKKTPGISLISFADQCTKSTNIIQRKNYPQNQQSQTKLTP